MENLIKWVKKVRWKKQIIDQAAHLAAAPLIVWLVFIWPWLIIIVANFIMYEREYYQSNPTGKGTFLQKLKNIKLLKLDMFFLYAGTIISIIYVIWK